MKKFILWLAKVFKVELPQKTVAVTVEKEVARYYYDGDVVDGNLSVKGDLTVNGTCIVNGELKAWRK